MIEARDLTKRYGDKTAVDHLSFTVEPGRVTGFLGPNGAGKSTTMRLILGLDRPNAGTATIDGRAYADLNQPLRTVGALLEAKAMHPGRSAYNHLLFLAQTQGLPRSRVDQVLDLVGLREVARKRTGGYSLGMGQRVGIAVAMLGDPQVLLLDEPVNGLDPEGILWIRNLMKHLASEGRTIFVSSHLMNEMAVTADHLIVIGRGKLIAESSTQEFIARSSDKSVLVRSPDAARLAELIAAEGGKAEPQAGRGNGGAGLLRVTGLDAAADRRAGRRRPGRAARAHPAAGLAGGGLHGTDIADSSEYGVGATPAAQPAGGTTPASTTPAHQRPASAPVHHGVRQPRGRTANDLHQPGRAGRRAPAVPPPIHHVGFGHLMLAEWTKIRSVRSTVWTLLLFVVITRRLHRAVHLADRVATGPARTRRRGTPPIVSRSGRLHPRRRHRPRPAHHLRAGRAGDHHRVLHRGDPRLAAGRAQAAADAGRQGGRVRRR